MDSWEMSGPEEGDQIDKRVFICNVDAPDYEVIEIKAGTTRQKKKIGRQLAHLLNKAEAVLT